MNDMCTAMQHALSPEKVILILLLTCLLVVNAGLGAVILVCGEMEV